MIGCAAEYGADCAVYYIQLTATPNRAVSGGRQSAVHAGGGSGGSFGSGGQGGQGGGGGADDESEYVPRGSGPWQILTIVFALFVAGKALNHFC